MPDRPQSWAERGPLGVYSDAARRISDAVTLHLTVAPIDNCDRWLAFRLDDGTPDPTLYDTKNDAMRHHSMFASLYGYAQLHPTGMNPQEAESYLRFCRQVADNPNVRWRNTDHEAPAEMTEAMMSPFRREDFR